MGRNKRSIWWSDLAGDEEAGHWAGGTKFRGGLPLKRWVKKSGADPGSSSAVAGEGSNDDGGSHPGAACSADQSPPACGSAVAGSGGGDDSADGEKEVCTDADGASIPCGTSQGGDTDVHPSDYEELDGEGAAVAALDAGAERPSVLWSGDSVSVERHVERPKGYVDNRLPMTSWRPTAAQQQRAAETEKGNVGWTVGNWGKVGLSTKEAHVAQNLRSLPSQVLVLCECTKSLEDRLTQEHVQRPAVAGAGGQRAEYQYVTVRPTEDSSLLVGCRVTHCTGLEVRYWHKRADSHYKRSNTDRTRATAYSRILVVTVAMPWTVDRLGDKHTVMAVHLHYMTAKKEKGFAKAYKDSWDELCTVINQYNVDVLAGDFNMALCEVIPEMRSRGLEISLASWYPWRGVCGEMMMDSMAIFIIGQPGEYELVYPPTCLHDRNASGFLFNAGMGAAVAAHQLTPSAKEAFHRHRKNGGPGQEVRCYLDKSKAPEEKIGAMLDASELSRAAVAARNRAAAQQCEPEPMWRCKQKPLSFDLFYFNGQNHGGSHFPQCVMTKNRERRSAAKQWERSQKRRDKQQAKQWARRHADAADGTQPPPGRSYAEVAGAREPPREHPWAALPGPPGPRPQLLDSAASQLHHHEGYYQRPSGLWERTAPAVAHSAAVAAAPQGLRESARAALVAAAKAQSAASAAAVNDQSAPVPRRLPDWAPPPRTRPDGVAPFVPPKPQRAPPHPPETELEVVIRGRPVVTWRDPNTGQEFCPETPPPSADGPHWLHLSPSQSAPNTGQEFWPETPTPYAYGWDDRGRGWRGGWQGDSQGGQWPQRARGPSWHHS